MVSRVKPRRNWKTKAAGQVPLNLPCGLLIKYCIVSGDRVVPALIHSSQPMQGMISSSLPSMTLLGQADPVKRW